MYYAHISPDGARRQTVLDHLTGTAVLAEGFAAAFGAEAQGRTCGMAHDLGKYSAAFQRRLEGGPPVDHSTAGAVELCGLGMLPAALAVAGHHGGLPDLGGPGDTAEDVTLVGRRKRAQQGLLPDCAPWRDEVSLSPAPQPDFCGHDGFTDAFFTRMLYSCLVDADYLDTETFMAGRPAHRGGGPSLAVLRNRLMEHIGPWLENREADTLNGRRSAILRACVQAGAEPAPMRTLTVPTGGGKTAASLAYALCHGAKHGKSRVIYVIPYTSIIEQTADNFRGWLGDDAVLEHHSGVDYTVEERETADPDTVRKALATENWDAPVVVTTAVQFFESLYASRSSRCRKLHNIANTVVVFDEAQMLPLPYLRPCVAAIAQLVEHYGVTAVLCTATQPALGPLFQDCAPGLALKEIAPDPAGLYAAFRRVTLRHIGTLDTPTLAQRLGEHAQVLCIVSSRKQAQEVYRLLPPEGAFHLSTLMPPVRRRAVLETIRGRLKAGLPCRVVSTSLIECGVDVDFPAVYRAEAGLDSILQAAGRCNREGRRGAEESVVSVFASDQPVPPLFRPQVDAFRTVSAQHGDVGGPDAIRDYFEILRHRLGDAAQDRQDILDAFRRGRDGRLLPIRTVAEQFHLIDSPTRTVYLPIDGEGRTLCARLEAGERSRALFRRLGQYGVSVYPDHLHALCAAGAVQAVDEEAFLLRDLSLYDDHTGLSLEADSGKGLFI